MASPATLPIYCPGLGATLSDGSRLPALLYADDVALLATSPDDLQTLIDSSAAFCKAVGLPPQSC